MKHALNMVRGIWRAYAERVTRFARGLPLLGFQAGDRLSISGVTTGARQGANRPNVLGVGRDYADGRR